MYFSVRGVEEDRPWCDVEAESLELYRPGGYHPIHLHETLKKGQYTILHKLGFGGYATVWLAKDHHHERHVAIKIIVSEPGPHLHEADIYRRLSDGPCDHPGRSHIAELLDVFDVSGPNGSHVCLVSEVLGIPLALAVEDFQGDRLPGRMAWSAARQITQALAYIHEVGIVHGDLHPGNVLFTISESEILKDLDTPVQSDVVAKPNSKKLPHLPKYLVRPAFFPRLQASNEVIVKLVDFGSSYLVGDEIGLKMFCPLPFRAPEAILTNQWNAEADIWSLAVIMCTLVVGYWPFETFWHEEQDIMLLWQSFFGDFPGEWAAKTYFDTISDRLLLDSSALKSTTLQEWLYSAYKDHNKPTFFTEAELGGICKLLLSMFRYRPEERPSSQDLMQHPMLRCDPFGPRQPLQK